MIRLFLARRTYDALVWLVCDAWDRGDAHDLDALLAQLEVSARHPRLARRWRAA